MSNKPGSVNARYLILVSVLVVIVPVLGAFLDMGAEAQSLPFFALFGKWFIFSAVGLRLFVAGLQQTANPAFTAREIFHFNGTESFPVVRELGFANLCFGAIGIFSLFLPSWRIVSAFGSGLYYGLAALLHVIKKPAGTNEQFALVTDVLIFGFLLVYCIRMF